MVYIPNNCAIPKRIGTIMNKPMNVATAAISALIMVYLQDDAPGFIKSFQSNFPPESAQRARAALFGRSELFGHRYERFPFRVSPERLDFNRPPRLNELLIRRSLRE